MSLLPYFPALLLRTPVAAWPLAKLAAALETHA
jgi:hypothetical protein